MRPVLELLGDFYVQRTIVYGFIAFFSLFIIAPLGDLRTQFTDERSSKCILYSDVVYDTSNPHVHYFKIRFGQETVCEYSIAVTVLFCLLYPLLAGTLYIFLYHKTKKDDKFNLAHWHFYIHVLVELAVLIVMLVSACVISAGFSSLCGSLTSGGGSINSCKDAQNFADWRGFDGSKFYICLSVATAGSWLVFVSWLFQGFLGVWKLWKLNVLPLKLLVCCRR